MELSMSCHLVQSVSLTQSMRQMFGETSGDIPLYSLHRISNLLQKKPIDLPSSVTRLLRRCLVEANRVYREESGNKRWNCLTSHNLVNVIERVEVRLSTAITAEKIRRPEDAMSDSELQLVLDQVLAGYIKKIQNWFEENYDQLLYIMDGKIPWPVIRRLQKNLSAWIAGVANYFSEDIEEMVLDVARSENVISDDSREAWQAMGGTVFNAEED